MNGTNGKQFDYPEIALVPYPVILAATKGDPDAMMDKMFQQIIDKGLKPSTAAGAKRVLSVTLGHTRKYRYIETNAARDTPTKFGKGDKTPDPYTSDLHSLENCLKIWKCHISVFTICAIRRLQICTN